MVVLTRKADYALLAMTYLGYAAENGERISSAREIAVRYSIPLPVLMNILKTLQREGLIDSIRGSHGGYRLAGPASSINLAGIISAIEGPVRVTKCIDAPERAEHDGCERSHWCPVRGPVQVVQERLEQFFREITLADVVEGSCGASAAAFA